MVPGAATSDFTDCTGPQPITLAVLSGIPAPSGGTALYKFCYITFVITSFFQMPNIHEGGAKVTFLQSVVLPDKTSWIFEYNDTQQGAPAGTNYGNLTKITLPTGGTISYSYANVPQRLSRQLASRILDANDGSGPREWDYSYISTPSSITTTVTAPAGSGGVRNQTVHSFLNQTLPQTTVTGGAVETRTDSYSGAQSPDNLAMTVTTDYLTTTTSLGNTGIYAFPIRKTTSLRNGTTSKIEFDYDSYTTTFPGSNTQPNSTGSASLGDVTAERYFDYGSTTPGPLLRSVQRAFVTDTAYLANNLVHLVTQEKVLDRANNQFAFVQYGYDETALANSQVTTQLDTNVGSVRGNQTTTSRWLNTTASNVTTTQTYFDTGMIASETNPLKNTTQYSYSLNFAGAYQTQTQFPDTCSPTCIHHVIGGDYDFNTGLLTKLTDENGNPTTYSYDQLFRVKSIVSPPDLAGNTPETDLDYPDPNTVKRTRKQDSTHSIVDYSYLDGLRRLKQTRLVDPQGDDFIDTSYDELGRVAAVSNPHRSTTGATDGATTRIYDALDRVTILIPPDGTPSNNNISTDFSTFPSVTVTDQVGTQKRITSDALGRVIEVDEPGDAFPGSVASANLSIIGSLQTKSGTSSTPGTAWVTVSGSEKSKSGVGATQGSPGTGIVYVGGAGWQCGTDGNGNSICDIGNLSVTINGSDYESFDYGNQGPYFGCAASYNTTALYQGVGVVATLMANCISAQSPYVTASFDGSKINLRAKSNGRNSNYSLSAGYSYDSVDFSQPSFAVSASGPNLTGGTDANPGTTVYDQGTCTVTVNGTGYSQGYSQGDNTSTIASGLASKISAGSWANASASGATISLTAKTGGAATNYPLSSSTSCSYDSSNFSSASFTTTSSGGTFTGGTTGSPATDAGTVQMSISGYTATANYGNGPGQDSTASAVASDLVAKIQAQLPASNPLFTISASGTSININWGSVGTSGNVTVTTTSTTSQTANFSTPSFASCSITTNPQACSATLSGGSNPAPGSLSSPYVTLYSYDPLGNLLTVTQKGNPSSSCNPGNPPGSGDCPPPSPEIPSHPWRIRTFTYDSLSRLVAAQNPESGKITYTFDGVGNMLQKTSPAPNAPLGSASTQTISYCFDTLNRVTGRAYSAQACTNGQLPSGTAVVSYVYDQGTNGIGHLTSLTDQAGTGSYSYDPIGRPATETRTINPGQGMPSVSKSVSYDYNLDGSLKALHYPSGSLVTYTSDTAGRVGMVQDLGNNIAYVAGAGGPPTLVSYGPNGSVTGFLTGNTGSFAGVTNALTYNQRLQPISISASSTNQSLFSLVYDFHLGTGNNGNVYGISNNRDHTRDQTFTYDPLNRLVSAQNAGTDCNQKTLNPNQTKFWGNGYSYDPWNNLLSKSVTKCGAESFTLTVNANNQLQGGYAYDAAGNMIHDATTGNDYSYDQENRITGAAGFTYTYDRDGHRVAKSNGTAGTIYWYMSPGIVAESDLSGTIQSEYIFFNGERIARRDVASGTGATLYYFADYLKTVSVVADSAGNIMAESDYYPWGGELPFVANDPNVYKYTGKPRDHETQLDYFGARYYAAWAGRFLSTDPLFFQASMLADPQRFNLYTYARNNPLKYVDPSGERIVLGGDIQWILETILYPMAGGKDKFDATFHIEGNQVVLNQGVDPTLLTDGLALINSLVSSPDNYLYYASTNGDQASRLFQNTTNSRGKLNGNGKDLRDKFTCGGSYVAGCGMLVGTSGREGAEQPANLANGDPVFAVIAFNERAQIVQTGYGHISKDDYDQTAHILATAGMNQPVAPVRFFIHESAENITFRAQGSFDYLNAHLSAIIWEAHIAYNLNMTGGFAGAFLRTTINH
jgi:RHS repeat-associated protein